MASRKMIRVGVFGLGRGRSFIRLAEATNMKLVAICDQDTEKLKEFEKENSVVAYENFDKFLEHEMDAVILANYFHEHAPYAIKALKAGKHVLSECAAVHTLAEACELVEAVEQSGCIYMFSENYPFSAASLELKRLYQDGVLGEFRYGECEYVHPDLAEVQLKRSPGVHHWRNWIPATYYCTHSIAPVMYITNTMPTKVNALVIPRLEGDPNANPIRLSDQASVMMLTMNNGGVLKAIQYDLRGHGNYTRIHGSKALAETTRDGFNSIRLKRETWDKKENEPAEMNYQPEFPQKFLEAKKAGHGGGDFYVNYYFSEAIRKREQPYLDVYRGVAMSVAGIQGWRSVLADGASFEIPDFSKKEVRKKYANDHWSPDPTRKLPKQHRAPHCKGKPYIPNKKQIKEAEKLWKQKV